MLPLEDVPDPVFAGKMVGDGVSIDPVTSTLLAPCDAEILSVHPAAHAVTLRTEHDVELIVHIGLDTVSLRGDGFLPLRKKGERVRTGEPLIEFAADYVVTHAPSLLTQLIVATPERVSTLTKRSGYVEAGRDIVLEAIIADTTAPPPLDAPSDAGETLLSREIIVRDPTGLHARPAAVLAGAARRFNADVRVRCGTREANARSVTGVMGLEIGAGERLVLAASGNDARAALDALVPLLASGLEDHPQASPGPSVASAPEPARRWSGHGVLLQGIAASEGIAVGHVVPLAWQEIPTTQPAGLPQEERAKLDDAIVRAQRELHALSAQGAGSGVQGGIFRAHLALLDDPDLVEFSYQLLASGAGAATAWHQSFSRLEERLAGARSELFAERAADVRDVGRRVLRLLAGVDGITAVSIDDAIIVAPDVSPSDAATFDRTRVRGFCTVTGGKTSHVAILARSFGIPAVTGIDPRVLDVAAGTRVILDGTSGALLVDPSDEDVMRAVEAIEVAAGAHRVAVATAGQPATTADGVRIEVAANVGGGPEAMEAATLGADGVGLLRSEFLFLDRLTAPDEDEQYEAYAAVARAFGQASRVVIRTLDVGGDKPLAYLPLPKEENPFLGIRGIRLAAERPALLRTQLRAILRASRHGHVHVMFPMVTTMDDWRLAKGLLDEEQAALGVDPIPAGIMVEVPAAALTAGLFAAEADFFSIGTNDLTQYTLAMDRGHPALAPQVDALHPAVLHLIDMTARAAHARGRWVGVCGALAGEESAVPILLGLGIDELSVAVPAVPSIKAHVRTMDLARCRELAARALTLQGAAEVRALVIAATGN
ncbi:MAG: phosphoenolpyruvate--protein phosphotransferase [Acidobacteria bacterium]|nr:phosphoenolpyruvate--protein phosphotransferase [Acidobacteriota bacterium]